MDQIKNDFGLVKNSQGYAISSILDGDVQFAS